MDREKMEEVAAYYAKEANVTREDFELSDLEDAVIVGMEFIMNLPLNQRLTDEERQALKELSDKYAGNYMKTRNRMEAMYWEGCLEGLLGILNITR